MPWSTSLFHAPLCSFLRVSPLSSRLAQACFLCREKACVAELARGVGLCACALSWWSRRGRCSSASACAGAEWCQTALLKVGRVLLSVLLEMYDSALTCVLLYCTGNWLFVTIKIRKVLCFPTFNLTIMDWLVNDSRKVVSCSFCMCNQQPRIVYWSFRRHILKWNRVMSMLVKFSCLLNCVFTML